MNQYAVGVDLGGTFIKAGLIERGRGLVHRGSAETNAEKGPDAVVARITDAVREMIARSPSGAVEGIGVGSPGSINWDRTTVTKPPNFPGWQEVDLRAELQRRLKTDVPVIVENDANAAGLGSAFYGAGRAFDSFIMITLGTGVGGAIIYQKKIFRGSTGGAGEIGHITIDYEGPTARSGVAGAVEAYLGQRFLSHHARFKLLPRHDSIIHEMASEDLENVSPKMLYEAAKKGDKDAREVLAWAGHKLGCALGVCINLLDIRKVVVGGGISAAGDLILEPARQTMVKYVLPGLTPGIELVRETLGNEVASLGAAHLVFEHMDEHIRETVR